MVGLAWFVEDHIVGAYSSILVVESDKGKGKVVPSSSADFVKCR